MGKIDEITQLAARLAGDAPPVAGYLTYNPGPGIYSRMERAVEALPENVRVQELPGLLKRYKDGIPGWELKAVDLDSLTAGRDVVPRSEILAAVKERSPVYTHREVVLGGRPQTGVEPVETEAGGKSLVRSIDRQEDASRLGEGVSHGDPMYSEYSQGGRDYTEVLLTQPGHSGLGFNSHWSGTGKPQDQAVAHARFDTHGDALRINELQSDLGIHNRKMRARGDVQKVYDEPPQLPSESDADYAERLTELGYETAWTDDGFLAVGGRVKDSVKPFPLEDAWADLLIKRLALEAARQGHRAIEVASPASVFAKTGNRGDAAASLARMEHFYGKVVPGAVERLGQRMGGLAEEQVEQLGPRLRYELPFNGGELVAEPRGAADRIFRREFPQSGPMPAFDVGPGMAYNKLEWAYSHKPESVGEYATLLQFALANRLKSGGMEIEEATRVAGQRMPEIVRLAEEQARRADAYDRVQELRDAQAAQPGWSPSRLEAGRRYIMSDEMRRRILQEGIPAAVAIGIGTDQVLDRLDKQAPPAQVR